MPISEDVFVGRERELRELDVALTDSMSGRGNIVLVGGEPGIGKSRLAAELAGIAAGRGARILWGRCWEAGGAPAYWPWVQSIRSYVRDQERSMLAAQLGIGAADVAQIVPELREILEPLEAPTAGDPEGARFRLFDSVATFLRNAANVQPLVLVLDDLHAADVPSLLLLRFMADEIADAGIMVLGTYRSEEIDGDHPLASTLYELARRRSSRDLRLTGLNESDTARFIAAVAQVAPPSALSTAVFVETEGNPLFVGEVVRLLAAEGQLEATREAPIRIAIPAKVREAIDRRLRRLTDACLRTLTVASVIGRDFGLDVLGGASRLAREEIFGDIDEAIGARVVVEVPGAPGRMSFSHALIREVIYDGLMPRRRMELHQQVGEALEAILAEDLEPNLAELAHHYYEAVPVAGPRRAIDFASRAGDAAVGLLAYEEAVRLYRLGLEVARGSADEGPRIPLLLALGDAQMRAGDVRGARGTFRDTAAIARSQTMPDALAHAALGYGGRFVWARSLGDPYLVPLLQEALDALPDEDGALRARLLARLAGGPLRDTETLERREAMSQAAVEMARRLGDPATIAYALDGRHCANMGPDVVARRLETADELIQVAQAVGDTERAFAGHDYRLHALLEVGDLLAAREEYGTLRRLADRLRQPAQRWYVGVNGAKLALFEGRFADAEDAIVATAELGRSAQNDVNVQMAFDLQMYALRREQGRLDELADVVELAVTDFPMYPVWRYVQLDVLVQLGRGPDARIAFDDLAAHGFPLYLEMQWLFGISLAAEACASLGDADRASVLYELLLPYAHLVPTLPPELCRGSVARDLGNLAVTVSDREAAVRHFDDALRMNARVGARPWVAYTQHDYARMLLHHDEPGDRELATTLLAEAQALSRDMGMVALNPKIAALLERDAPRSASGQELPESALAPGHGADVFHREGEYWSIRFGPDAFRLKDSKGLRYLAQLLANPGHEMLSLEVATTGSASAPADPGGVGTRKQPGLRLSPDRPEAILDARSKAAYRRRLEELEEEEAEAEGWSDPIRAARAREEMDFLARELAAAVGLGGRDRRAASPAERARVNVTKAIRSAVSRIERQSPALAAHLTSTVRTGTYCSYSPDPRLPATWRF